MYFSDLIILLFSLENFKIWPEGEGVCYPPPPKKVGKIPILWYCTLFWRSRLDEKKSTVKTIVFTHLSKGWLKKVDGWKVTLSNLILMVNCIFNDLGYFYFIMTLSKLNLVRWGSKRQRWKNGKTLLCVILL